MNAEVEIKSALHSALAAAFPDIEGATKDSTNPHFKSQYADLASVVAAIKPALIKQGLFFTQGTEPSEVGVIVETMVHHSSGESMSFGRLFVPANKNDAQGFGSALTYARRYSLMTAFGVAPEDDDGNAAVKSAPAKVPGISKIKERLNNLMREGNKASDLAEFNELVGFHKDDLTKIKETNHDYWHGDGEDSEGFKAWIKRRRDELAPVAETASYQLLVRTLMECTTRPELDTWTTKNMALVDILSDEERRKFEEKYDAAEAALLAVGNVSAG